MSSRNNGERATISSSTAELRSVIHPHPESVEHHLPPDSIHFDDFTGIRLLGDFLYIAASEACQLDELFVVFPANCLGFSMESLP